MSDLLKCYLVSKDAESRVSAEVTERSRDDLPEGEVLVRVAYSSLNYKDALAATGQPGVNRIFPHVPGVDAAGTVAESGVYEFVEGDPVIVTGFDMGSNRWGGWAEYVSVPQDWIVPLPERLTLRQSMILGTAGLTAGFSIDAIQRHGVTPDSGPVVVTGASGGVGSMAVAILSKLGYRVSAVSGKPSAHEFLTKLGAAEILPRERVDDRTDKPLLPRRWAGAVDTVGGNTLGTIIRSTQLGGCVAACGLVGGGDLPVTVYPFILRGVTLAGIDAAWATPLPLRHETWFRLSTTWKPDLLEEMAQFVELDQLPEKIDDILAGRMVGRTVVTIGGEEPLREDD